jgi:hypothetical protein
MRAWTPALLALAVLTGCQTDAPPPVKTGFLSTYRHLEQQDANSWVYIDPNNRLARYDKFVVNDVEIRFPEGSQGMDTAYGDVEQVREYMKQAVEEALKTRYTIANGPAWNVCDVRIALTDAYDAGGRVGVACEGELLDSVSHVQIAALVESQLSENLTISRFWTEQEAKAIMDGWADRLLAAVDRAHGYEPAPE